MLYTNNAEQHSTEMAELTNIVREGYDTPTINDHKQNCGSASAESKRTCIMPSASNFAAGKAEYPPIHTVESGVSLILQ